MGVKNVFKAWNPERFKELLKMPDKRVAYNYRLEILGHPIPEKYLTDAEKRAKGIEIDTPEVEKDSEVIEETPVTEETPTEEVPEEERKVVNGRVLDTEEEIRNAVSEDALEPEEEEEEETVEETTPAAELTEEEKATEETEEVVETPEVEEKKELTRPELFSLLDGAGIKVPTNMKTENLVKKCEENKLL